MIRKGRLLLMKKSFQAIIILMVIMSVYCLGTIVNANEVENLNDELKVTALHRKYEKAKLLKFAENDDVSGEQEETIEIEEDLEAENIVIEEQRRIAEEKQANREKAEIFIRKLLESYIAGTKRITEMNEKAEKQAQEELIEVIESGENIIVEEAKEPVPEEIQPEEKVEENNGKPTNYVKVLDVTATAYCICQKCCGKSPSSPGYGVTASGLKIIPGTGMKVIAVDPKVVKLGTKVYVEGLNGAPDYGYAVAADTGGAIKNMKIDLYFDAHSDTIKWGRRPVKLYILPN
jgi:3D (Asp-Asp-Asp) domain-containing protein